MSAIGSVSTAQQGIALSILNRTTQTQQSVLNRVTTGLSVPSAGVNGGAFAVGQQLASDLGGLDAVNSQLAFGQGVTAVAAAAATNVSDTLIQARGVLTALSSDALSPTQRRLLSDDLARLGDQVQTSVRDAIFNDQNLLGEGLGRSLIANVDGDTITLSNAGLAAIEIDGAFGGGGEIDAATARGLLASDGAFTTFTTDVASALNTIGGDQRSLTNQISFNTAVSDATEIGRSAIVDTDLAADSVDLASSSLQRELSTRLFRAGATFDIRV